ncbi:trichohyalin-like [Ambystoma mexicanum]|uniref:trichohyalin-like n=1 Tax=Ambystoma mexicanum TaxID=8296 RepID=UPI0037E8A8DD
MARRLSSTHDEDAGLRGTQGDLGDEDVFGRLTSERESLMNVPRWRLSSRLRQEGATRRPVRRGSRSESRLERSLERQRREDRFAAFLTAPGQSVHNVSQRMARRDQVCVPTRQRSRLDREREALDDDIRQLNNLSAGGGLRGALADGLSAGNAFVFDDEHEARRRSIIRNLEAAQARLVEDVATREERLEEIHRDMYEWMDDPTLSFTENEPLPADFRSISAERSVNKAVEKRLKALRESVSKLNALQDDGRKKFLKRMTKAKEMFDALNRVDKRDFLIKKLGDQITSLQAPGPMSASQSAHLKRMEKAKKEADERRAIEEMNTIQSVKRRSLSRRNEAKRHAQEAFTATGGPEDLLKSKIRERIDSARMSLLGTECPLSPKGVDLHMQRMAKAKSPSFARSLQEYRRPLSPGELSRSMSSAGGSLFTKPRDEEEWKRAQRASIQSQKDYILKKELRRKEREAALVPEAESWLSRQKLASTGKDSIQQAVRERMKFLREEAIAQAGTRRVESESRHLGRFEEEALPAGRPRTPSEQEAFDLAEFVTLESQFDYEEKKEKEREKRSLALPCRKPQSISAAERAARALRRADIEKCRTSQLLLQNKFKDNIPLAFPTFRGARPARRRRPRAQSAPAIMSEEEFNAIPFQEEHELSPEEYGDVFQASSSIHEPSTSCLREENLADKRRRANLRTKVLKLQDESRAKHLTRFKGPRRVARPSSISLSRARRRELKKIQKESVANYLKRRKDKTPESRPSSRDSVSRPRARPRPRPRPRQRSTSGDEIFGLEDFIAMENELEEEMPLDLSCAETEPLSESQEEKIWVKELKKAEKLANILIRERESKQQHLDRFKDKAPCEAKSGQPRRIRGTKQERANLRAKVLKIQDESRAKHQKRLKEKECKAAAAMQSEQAPRPRTQSQQEAEDMAEFEAMEKELAAKGNRGRKRKEELKRELDFNKLHQGMLAGPLSAYMPTRAASRDSAFQQLDSLRRDVYGSGVIPLPSSLSRHILEDDSMSHRSDLVGITGRKRLGRSFPREPDRGFATLRGTPQAWADELFPEPDDWVDENVRESFGIKDLRDVDMQGSEDQFYQLLRSRHRTEGGRSRRDQTQQNPECEEEEEEEEEGAQRDDHNN